MKTKKQKEKEMLLSIIEEQKELNKSLLEHNNRLLKENRELRNKINAIQTEITFQNISLKPPYITTTDGKHELLPKTDE